jgi:thymidine kinase
MFSGKSTEIIQRIRKHRIIGHNMLIINHAKDIRYSSDAAVVSHNNEREVAVSCSKLSDMFNMPTYATADIIFIEEAQFFPDLYDTVFKAVENDYKHLVVAGLDGDYLRQPFDTIKLIPIANDVIKLKALCAICKNGNPALFSKRLDSSVFTREVVGGADKYIPVCRHHIHTITHL